MNEKTEELRELFTSVTDGEATVTESQEDTRGSLATDDKTVEQRLTTVITQMRDRYAFDTDLTDEQLRTVVRRFYDGEPDETIADALGVEPSAVFDARLSLHLVADADAPDVDLAAIRDSEADDATLAAEHGIEESAVPRYRRVATAVAESRAANDRYRDEFDSILADTDITGRMAADVREDGLQDATEGMETDVSF